ncbi:hypothetical protein GCM10010302_30770 [Streptomyces polychromogenes]|uniref:Uncharacterized protein n=1 Tax=Streptomyces polychromogenes TaxID=67342 RepID=A0ABN0VDC3_9ACTN
MRDTVAQQPVGQVPGVRQGPSVQSGGGPAEVAEVEGGVRQGVRLRLGERRPVPRLLLPRPGGAVRDERAEREERGVRLDGVAGTGLVGVVADLDALVGGLPAR